MEKLKKIIILLILLVICIIGILLIKKIEHKKEVNTAIAENKKQIDSQEVLKEDYFMINSCIRSYLKAINIENSAYYRNDENGNYVKVIEEDVIKGKIYDLLSENFITKNTVSVENIYNKIDTIDKEALFIPLQIEVINNSNVKSYYVKGLVESIYDYSIIMDLNAIVNIDKTNNSFSIEVLKEKYKKEDIVNVQSIEKNENNAIYVQNINNQLIAEDYLKLYKGTVLGNPELVYNYLLDEEYKNKRFENFEEFKEYIQTNRELIFGARVIKYGVNSENGYDEYLVIDQNGNYYFFKENKIMDYSILLDNYTIDSKTFLAKYNSSNDKNKVGLNIQKFIVAINNDDYRYAYNCLSQGFKDNYFSTQESFEQYIKQNFYDKNRAEFIKFNADEDLYTYKIEIFNGESQVGQKIEKTVIMKLNEGTNFEMSFNIN